MLQSLFDGHGFAEWPPNVKIVILNGHMNPADHKVLLNLQQRYAQLFSERVVMLHTDSPEYQMLKYVVRPLTLA